MKRRKFFRNSLALLAPTIIQGNPIYLLNDNHPLFNTNLLANVTNDNVLVIVQLSGGNDGLNTVIPISEYSNYYNARKNIAVPENAILKLNGYEGTGLNPAMSSLQSLFNDGKINVVQSVGYAKTNFSHFRATDIWMSGSDSDQYLNTGWAGRFLDQKYPNYPDQYPSDANPDPLAIQIGSISTLTCQGPVVNMGLSISDPSSFYNLLDGSADPLPNTNAGYELSFIRTIAKQTNKYAARIKTASDSVTQQATYPTGNSLANQLKIVARLIKGGLQTKIYLVSYGGFDTHANQVTSTDTTKGTHANLLGNVSNAIKAFQDDLAGLGVEDRVLGMTFSEFGRRIKSNASGGTDHGAAAPLFLFGKKVNGGVTGINPLIPSSVTSSDNINYQYDFRSVYNSILQNWFCVSESNQFEILLKKYPIIPVINSSVCGVANTTDELDKNTHIKNYPNPFSGITHIEYKTNGGHTRLELLNMVGNPIQVLLDFTPNTAGIFSINFNGSALMPGIYYLSLQNEADRHVISIVKI